MIGGSSFDSTPLIFVDFAEGGHLVPIGITNWD
jgi:hypothetical protein